MAEIAPIPTSHRDLLAAPGTAVVTTLGTDGYPQTTAVWFLLDGDVIRTSLHRSRQKYKNLLRHAQANLFVIDPTNPGRTIEVRADASLDDDVDNVFLARLLAHYGRDLSTFGAPTDDRVTLTLTPRHVVPYGAAAG